MNEKALIEAMKCKDISRKDMCDKLKISRTAFYRKCKGISEFTLSEVQLIVNILELENPCDIFFANKVS